MNIKTSKYADWVQIYNITKLQIFWFENVIFCVIEQCISKVWSLTYWKRRKPEVGHRWLDMNRANFNGHRYICSPDISLHLTLPVPNNDYSFMIYASNFRAINQKALKLLQILYQPIRANCTCMHVHL